MNHFFDLFMIVVTIWNDALLKMYHAVFPVINQPVNHSLIQDEF